VGVRVMSEQWALSLSVTCGFACLLGLALIIRSCDVTKHADTTERIKAVCSGDLLHDAAKSSACILVLKNAEGGN